MKNQKSMPAWRSSPRDVAVPCLMIVGPVEDDCGHLLFNDFHCSTPRAQNCLEFAIEAQCRPPCIVVCERDLSERRSARGIVAARPAARYRNLPVGRRELVDGSLGAWRLRRFGEALRQTRSEPSPEPRSEALGKTLIPNGLLRGWSRAETGLGKMSSCLNAAFGKSEAAPTRIGQMLQRAGVILVFTVSFSVLYTVMLLLAIGDYMIRKNSTWESRGFSTT